MTLLIAAAAAFSFGTVNLDCEKQGDWQVDLSRETAPDGAEIAVIKMKAPAPAVPPKATLRFEVPQVGIDYCWNVNTDSCQLRPDWGSWTHSELANNAPHYAFFDGNDTCRLAVTASEAARRLRFRGGVREEGSRLRCEFVYFDAVEAPISTYETRVRIDARTRPFADAVREGAAWMEKASGYTPCAVPEAAFDPLYSSWYNFHQDVTDKALEAECAIAAKLGMKVLIVDDGWQTDDNNRGYAFCGDWNVSTNRFPDMRAHVKRVQAMGIKYMMWYSVPFMGLKSANHARFKGKFLKEDCGLGAAVLDPRFPEVRRFLVDTYVQALKDWDIDGFKLDFIDSFRFDGRNDPAEKDNYAGRDIKSVPAAVDKLMTEVRDALSAIKPDILIEFRQSYVGPAIRQYGNMLRVGDCPGDMRRNRFAIANLRLASGGTAVHADMLEWNFKDTPEHAALFILNSIFGVVQYSVLLKDAPEAHRNMVAHWIRFSQEHRETLLHGTFTPHHAELMYPLIEAEGADERIIGVYDDGRVVDCGDLTKPTYVINATGTDKLVLRLPAGAVKVDAVDTFGRPAAPSGGFRFSSTASCFEEIACPEAGYLKITKTEK